MRIKTLLASIAVVTIGFTGSANAAFKTSVVTPACTNHWMFVEKGNTPTDKSKFDSPVNLGNGWMLYSYNASQPTKDYVAGVIQNASVPTNVEHYDVIVLKQDEELRPPCSMNFKEVGAVIRLPK